MTAQSWLCALALTWVCLPAYAAPVVGQGTWEATLHARDINRDGVVDGYFDSSLGVTWLADWNAAGPMNWYQSKSWAATLDVFGVRGWRLPTSLDTGASGCDLSPAGGTDCGYNPSTASSELAHMFYITLGNLARCAPGDGNCDNGEQIAWGLSNTANFANVQRYYFAGAEFIPDPNAPSPGLAWSFYAYDGFQGAMGQHTAIWAVAVRDGEIQPVSEPAAVNLLLSVGVLAMLGLLRRRRLSCHPTLHRV